MMKEVMIWAGAGQIGMAIARRMGFRDLKTKSVLWKIWMLHRWI